ncbi:hypothetical protein [Kitasatospora sp. NPDC093806]|uniref:hypothetical protein n=1 Tax=Kitasatospora sp. NPDC093806 TaxID=3155075 RepID=UPI00344AAB32
MAAMEFEQLEQEYKEALARIGRAQDAVTELRGPVDPLGPGDPAAISPQLRAAENEAQQAFNAYIPLRDRYWATRWGREGNPPKA